jgi:uncharacterized membrane protein
MHFSHYHFLPLTAPFFSMLALLLVALFALIQLGIVDYAYTRLGLSARAALLLLVASLLGSSINLPIAELPGEQVLARQAIDYFGMRYVVPVVVDWPGTVIAVNVGGALIPGMVSFYLLAKHGLWARGLAATAVVAAVCFYLATPVPGLGIALPIFVPALVTGITALVLSRADAAPLAYIGGSLGTLIGADLLNLGKIRGLGAPIASIGGAGTFDGIFVTGILAVLIASVPARWWGRPA